MTVLEQSAAPRTLTWQPLAAAAVGGVLLGLSALVDENIASWLTLALFVGFGIPISIIDAREHRIPNRLLFPLAASVFASLTAQTAVSGDWWRLLGAVGLGAALWGVYAAMSLFGAIGYGDVKLGAVIGLLLGWHSITAVIAATVLAYLLSAPHAIALIARRGSGQRLPFGPYLIAGAVVAAAAASIAAL